MLSTTILKTLFLILHAAWAASEGTNKDQAAACQKAVAFIEKRGFATPKIREIYCENACTGQSLRCDRAEKEGLGHLFDVSKLTPLFILSYDLPSMAATVQGYFDFDLFIANLTFFVPYMAHAVMFGVASTRSSYSVWFSGAVLTFCFWYCIDDMIGLIASIVNFYVCVTAPISTDFFKHAIVGLITLLGFGLYSITIQNVYMQPLFGIVIVFVFGSQFVRGITARSESARLCVILSLTNAVISIKYTLWLVSTYSATSVGLKMVAVFTHGALPWGPYGSVLANYFFAARSVAMSYPNHVVQVFVGAFTCCVFSFVFIRGCLGAFFIVSMNFKFEPRLFFLGFYSYMIDIFAPVHALIYVFGDGKHKHRVVLYATIMTALLVFEILYAHEVIPIRLGLCVLDYAVFKSGVASATKYLDVDVSFKGMQFPKDGALPFSSIRKLSGIAASVRRVFCYNGDVKVKQATGFLMSDARIGSRLYSVAHVFDGTEAVSFDNDITKHVLKSFVTHGVSEDPVMSACVDANTKTSLSFLQTNEVDHIAFLFMINRKREFCPVTDFEFDAKGNLSAVVTLEQGDSGSPFVCVMRDGSIRYAGCASRGTFNSGSGNLISVVCSEFNGSPGLENKLFEMDIDGTHRVTVLAKIQELVHDNAKTFLDFYATLSDDDSITFDDDEISILTGVRRDKYYRDHFDGQPHDKQKGIIRKARKSRAYEKRKVKLKTLLSLASVSDDVFKDFVAKFDDFESFEAYTKPSTLVPGFVPATCSS